MGNRTIESVFVAGNEVYVNLKNWICSSQLLPVKKPNKHQIVAF